MTLSTTSSDRALARRQQVLDAAAECFRRRGFHAASMAEIAKTAGMSPGHIYNLFENKDDIIAAIVERDCEEVLARIAEFQQSGDLLPQMVAGTEQAIGERSEVANSTGHAGTRTTNRPLRTTTPALSVRVWPANAGGISRVETMSKARFEVDGSRRPLRQRLRPDTAKPVPTTGH